MIFSENRFPLFRIMHWATAPSAASSDESRGIAVRLHHRDRWSLLDSC